MQAIEITDGESLEAWLNSRPEEDLRAISTGISFRAALRVFPLIFNDPGDGDFTEVDTKSLLRMLRLFLSIGCAHRFSDPASLKAIAVSLDAVSRLAFGSKILGSARFSARSAIAGSSTAVAASARSAASDAAAAVRRVAQNSSASANWQSIAFDAANADRNRDFVNSALWPRIVPDWFVSCDGALRFMLREDPSVWNFWLLWWDGVLSGNQLDWELQKAVALEIPEEAWSDPKTVAAHIREIEARFDAGREDVQAKALELTDNAETIVVNPETHLARLVGESDLPEEISIYARRKMMRAVALFDSLPDNQYTPMHAPLDVLRTALSDAANLPVELFDACASSTRMVATLVANEAIPKPQQDALIGEYVTLVREVGADILANDKKTQQVLERRNAILGNNALIENGDIIVSVAKELSNSSEGELSRAMQRDAEIATSPTPDVESRRTSSFKLVSRILRFAVLKPWQAALYAGGAVQAGQALWWAGEKIVASPQFKSVLEIALRYLGFG